MDKYGLLVYFSDEFTESDIISLRQLVANLAESHRWSNAVPVFIDVADDDDLREGDEPIRTVGCFLHLPPPTAVSSREAERVHYQEVALLVAELATFSKTSGREFELELGGTYVGSIANGKPDKLVAVGLLEEWRKVVEG